MVVVVVVMAVADTAVVTEVEDTEAVATVVATAIHPRASPRGGKPTTAYLISQMWSSGAVPRIRWR